MELYVHVAKTDTCKKRSHLENGSIFAHIPDATSWTDVLLSRCEIECLTEFMRPTCFSFAPAWSRV